LSPGTSIREEKRPGSPGDAPTEKSALD
jgi:hypothetical protein